MKRLALTAALTIGVAAACSTTSPTPTSTSAAIPAPATFIPSTATAAAQAGIPTAAVEPTSVPAPDASAFPNPQGVQWKKIVEGLQSPVDIEFAPDGRMFVIEQAGRIRIVKDGQLSEQPFLDITDRVESGGNEQGLLGLAFHPQYEQNGLFFVNYTDMQHHNVIARFRVSADPDRADPTSETDLVQIDDPFPNHNGGVLRFGPDGYLYAGIGDGGSGGDPFGNGQNTNSLLGKILRFDVDGGDPYATPPGNPFAQGGGAPEVWAYGLRNPWRISFDMRTGDLYIADVGQNTWEEVDFVPASHAGGLNFGWNYREGLHRYAGSPPASASFVDPVVEYSHAEGGCSITGGFVYRGAMAEWNGIYLYGDYCTGLIWGLLHQTAGSQTNWQSQLLFRTDFHITTFGQDASGEVYVADRGGGIYQLGRP